MRGSPVKTVFKVSASISKAERENLRISKDLETEVAIPFDLEPGYTMSFCEYNVTANTSTADLVAAVTSSVRV